MNLNRRKNRLESKLLTGEILADKTREELQLIEDRNQELRDEIAKIDELIAIDQKINER